MKEQIQIIIQSVCRDLFHIETKVELTRPEATFGDYSTNLALKLSKQIDKPASEIAEMIAGIINNQKTEIIDNASVAGPGFININLTSAALYDSYLNADKWSKPNKNKQILVEFGDPNPFKEMHLGHLYTSVEGDSIAHILEASGAEVKRLSYHGDVGLQVAKCIWGIGTAINWNLDELDKALKDNSLGHYYSLGNEAYKADESIAKTIQEINQHVYKRDDENINKIYDLGKKISFDQFDEVFKHLNIKFDKQYLESESADIGLATVHKYLGSVFAESEGAIVFKGEKVGLHTRVFITSQGLPTYDTKDLGLVELKHRDFPDAVKSIVITASEQSEYFKVMLAALKEINPELASITQHLAHGFLSLTTGKMSSRDGNIYAAKTLLDDVQTAVKAQYPNSLVQEEVFLSSIRYTFLKQKIGADIVFNVDESVSLEGNSGPYIQYAHARARSILNKAADTDKKIHPDLEIKQIQLQKDERHLAMKISEFPDVIEQAAMDYMPHHICTYLYELSQQFNSFYESNRVINNSRMFTRLHLVEKYADVLKKGLQVLNIPAPNHM